MRQHTPWSRRSTMGRTLKRRAKTCAALQIQWAYIPMFTTNHSVALQSLNDLGSLDHDENEACEQAACSQPAHSLIATNG